jgi:molybdopterin-guanine dinucleotide biosynthesis protein A
MAEELILSGDRSVRSLFAGSKVNRLEYTGDPDFLLNCNTPEVFEKAKMLYRG